MEDGWEKFERHYWEEIELGVTSSAYLPAEDSHLLAKAAYPRCSGRVLEIGCGSGIVSIACAKKAECIVATDINENAIKCTRKNAQKNKVKIKLYHGDLFDALPEKEGKFDVIMFNPPYLPTRKWEKVRGKLNYAFDGGESGNRVSERFIKNAGKWLGKNGKILLVVSSAQNLGRLREKIRESGFFASVIAQEDLFFERLQVWEIRRMEGKGDKGRDGIRGKRLHRRKGK